MGLQANTGQMVLQLRVGLGHRLLPTQLEVGTIAGAELTG